MNELGIALGSFLLVLERFSHCCMIDHIDIRELENIGDAPKVYLAITIHLKLNGYAPKYSIEYLRKINTEEKQKASHLKNDLLNDGGEGEI